MVNRRPELTVVAPGASPEEAAAVITAVQRFLHDRVPVLAPAAPGPTPWLAAALREGVARAPGLPPSWD